MKTETYAAIVSFLGLHLAAVAQTTAPAHPPDPQPLYRVTVVSRTLEAVNYEHRGGPTKIDFQGTVLMPKAKGEAIVESKRGRVSIDAKFDHMEPPTKFGREYLTYVLWAITPEGRPKNLGEVLVDSSNKAHLDVTTDTQAFGMIVTAEPYYAVTLPSDVVVFENVVRPDTIGNREEVTAKYELLPRGQYTLNIEPSQLQSASDVGKVSYDRYETILELYQAQNAVQIARSLGADRYAPDSFAKAESLLQQAQNLNARKADTHTVISMAREAAQTAEDARTIAVRKRDQQRQQQDQPQPEPQSRAIDNTQHELEQARADAAQARAEAAEAQAAAAAERAAADQARADAEQAQIIATQRAAEAEAERERAARSARNENAAPLDNFSQRQLRAELLGQFNNLLPTRDTPRGLVVTVADSAFEPVAETLRAPVSAQVSTLGSLLGRHPGLTIRVEGYTDDRGSDREDLTVSDQRAQAVRQTLLSSGLPANSITAVGYGKSRPIVANGTEGGREENRRVEIVVSGPSIGERALWDRTYSLK